MGRKKEMITKNEVAGKLMQGRKLTIEEFKIAVKEGFIQSLPITTDEGWAANYLDWVGQCYEDDEHYSYLCSAHPSRIIKQVGNTKTCCAFGRHMDEVKPEFLTKQNIKWLRHWFGKVKVKQVTGE